MSISWRSFTPDTVHSSGAFYLLDIAIIPSETVIIKVEESAAVSVTGKPNLASDELQVLNCESLKTLALKLQNAPKWK